VTAVRPPARFGGLTLNGDLATGFSEKSQIDVGWINGGFFVFEPKSLTTSKAMPPTWKRMCCQSWLLKQQLAAYKHPDFWQCMDTLREKRLLETLWNQGDQPWKVWKE
jgi:glucose-1-phosphate cytidylyltransferase